MDLRQFRNNRGLQRKFVASKIKISGKHLNDIEAGRVNLTDKVALRFSHLYSVNIQKIKQMYKEGKNE
ncbi:helix-turn-helix transcriptional regulator [Clostridium botulinum]|uniref:helix-turn-helix transcriptional regulator n=1 Tax=Clostridium botulinum TaxID=1491 RepID=UPI0001591F6C|nr:helix-turn-helix transcriptional regulator [Clostridium botulinum]EPS47398.1 DNA-binding protein [Clostridium botulinum CFSAN002367]ABS33223.1 putative DNA-binding protein [Clostridium botulinum A str. ATCC 19397]KON09724.1 XRE family transcriptional regulator [Clostridium botulinum]MBO3437610.1 helix-turn-helix transcriptional regulator [Clostridium botulinum]MBY6907411.1 helix-turn-helix transcriptional regulator [Clostridium botulinum]